MQKSDYELWLGYHYGQINRKLTDKVLQMCGGLNNLKRMNIYHNYAIVKKLAKQFCVPEDVMLFKLDYLIHKEEKKENEKSIKRRIKKKDGKILFVDFD